MQRLTAILIAICMGLIAASVGAVGYLLFRLSGAESALIALAVMTALSLYNMVSARLRDRTIVGNQIADLSRGTADLARQVGELGRRVNTLETQDAARRGRTPHDALAAEIGELGVLVKELAETVAGHDVRLQELSLPEPAAVTEPAPVPEFAPPPEPLSAPSDAAPLPVVENPQPQEPMPTLTPQAPAATGPLKGLTADAVAAVIAGAIEANRIDLYLQPVVTLPQRKVRYYEAMTRLRLEDGTLVLPSDFLPHAESMGLIAKIDRMQMFRCVQVLRRLMLKNREIGLFCNVSSVTLNDAEVFRELFDFLEANRALSGALLLEFSQAALRDMGPIEQESLAGLAGLGYRFSMDHVTDLRIGPRDLSELGIRSVKVPASRLLDKGALAADIHTADLSDLLGRHGISLIAERIESESVVVDLLDYDVRYGQGFLFSPPRPVRADALQGVTAMAGGSERALPEFDAAARAAV